MKTALIVALLACLAACGSAAEIAARTQSSVINGRGAANTGVLDGRHMPDS
jgi:hypothetical protein